jgi:helicase MOV-10
MQVAIGDKLHIFDALTVANFDQISCKGLGPEAGPRTLAALLQAEGVVKVLHDKREDERCLGFRGIRLTNVFDTQFVHSVLTGESRKSLQHVLKYWLNVDVDKGGDQMKQFMRTPHAWMRRPLPDWVLTYAALDVKHLPALYERMQDELQRQGKQELVRLSSSQILFTAPQAPPSPSHTPVRAAATATMAATAVVFGKELVRDERLRASIATKDDFVSRFNEWKGREYSRGQPHVGGAGSVLFFLKTATAAKRIADGLPRVSVWFGATGDNVRVVLDGAQDGARQGLRARKAAAAERVHDDRASVEANKGGVVVSAAAFDEVISVGSTAQCRIEIRNTSQHHRTMVAKLLLSAPGRPQSAFRLLSPMRDVELPHGATSSVVVEARPPWTGMHRDILSLNFGSFCIGRYLEARSGDAALHELLKPRGPYVRTPRKRPLPVHYDVVKAPKMVGAGGAPKKGPMLKWYGLYESLWPQLLERSRAEAEHLLMTGRDQMHDLRAGVTDEVAKKAYAQQQSRLLYTEEVQLLADLRAFDLEDEKASVLERRAGLLWLKVPGLAEKRPSVLRGDTVHVKPAGSGFDRKWVEGVAERIEQEEVGLRFSEAFAQSYTPGQRLDVHFVLGRTPLRLFHQGVEATREMRPSVLFPERSDVLSSTTTRRAMVPFEHTRAFDPNLNDEQRAAVKAVIDGRFRDVPYIIFGPPGTGKTTTVVELILQAAVHLPKTLLPKGTPFHILVATPTNTAADFVCQKLARKLGSKLDMLRLMAFSRSDDLPESIRKYTNWDAAAGGFVVPELEELLKTTVVVATLTKAAGLVNEGVPRGHFDLIVVDEAGQAFEAEAMAPIGCLLGPQTQLVIAGDPKQLGPVVHHSLAKENGLGTSYLERLMERSIYQKNMDSRSTSHGQFDERVITKLVRNYRAHELLIHLPNRLFYDGDLVSCVDPMLGNSCLGWEGLERQGVPLLWHGIAGKDMQERNSPSWFNNDEVQQVVAHVKDLLSMQRNKLTQADIGVITPYNQQVYRINLALRSQNLGNVKVGSTEMFQGQERRVIIISTVRSSEQWIDFDVRHNLGFLDNPKRFNVAITRAIALLIVVGNPLTLKADYHWRELLKYCVDHGAYRGIPLPDLSGHDALMATMATMTAVATEAAEATETMARTLCRQSRTCCRTMWKRRKRRLPASRCSRRPWRCRATTGEKVLCTDHRQQHCNAPHMAHGQQLVTIE